MVVLPRTNRIFSWYWALWWLSVLLNETAEQQLLYSEFIEHCRPSSILTLKTFKQLMCVKGLNADSCDNVFRWRRLRGCLAVSLWKSFFRCGFVDVFFILIDFASYKDAVLCCLFKCRGWWHHFCVPLHHFLICFMIYMIIGTAHIVCRPGSMWWYGVPSVCLPVCLSVHLSICLSQHGPQQQTFFTLSVKSGCSLRISVDNNEVSMKC